MILGIVGGVLLLCVLVCGGALFASGNAFKGFASSVLQSATQTVGAAQQTPTVNETLLYQDSMTDSPAGWTNNKQCAAKTDGYHVAGGFICFAPNSTLTDDVDVTVTAKAVKTSSNTSYGIVFRYESQGSFYSFVITPDGQWGVFKTINNTTTAVSEFQSNSSIRTGSGASNTLRVQVVGALFTCYINGQQVGTANDATFDLGHIGLIHGDSVTTPDVVFTNLTVAKPN